MEPFVGTYEHLTPPYSARKVQGVKSYELARRGEEVPVNRKEVTVYQYEATGDLSDEATIDFRLACSSGTYARSLAHELGLALDCGAHLASLRRLKVGGFDLSTPPLWKRWTPRKRSRPAGLDPVRYHPAALRGDRGRRQAGAAHPPRSDRPGPGSIASGEGDWVKISTRHRQFIAVASVVEQIGTGVGILQPRIVFK